MSPPRAVKRVEPVTFAKISALGVEEQCVWVIVGFADLAERRSRLGEAYSVNACFILGRSRTCASPPWVTPDSELELTRTISRPRMSVDTSLEEMMLLQGGRYGET